MPTQTSTKPKIKGVACITQSCRPHSQQSQIQRDVNQVFRHHEAKRSRRLRVSVHQTTPEFQEEIAQHP